MTIRLKTVEYAFTQDTASVTANTFRVFGPITITLPETTNRTFKSVHAVIRTSSNTVSSATTSANQVVQCQLGAASFNNISVVTDGNGYTYASMWSSEIIVELTSYFIANFGTTDTQTSSIQIKWPALTANVSIKYVITYTYDDIDTLCVKTVKIPLAGATGSLNTSLGELGFNEVPNLSGTLPESSIDIKDVFFEFNSICRKPSASTFVVGLALDAESSADDGTHQVATNTVGDLAQYRRIWKRRDMATDSAHSFKARSSVALSVFNPTVVMVVTYTYDSLATTRVLNSLMLPALTEQISATTQNIGTLTRKKIDSFLVYIEEDNPILLQSAVHWKTTQAFSGVSSKLSFRIGSGSFQSYSTPMITGFPGVAGYTQYMQRCDAGSLQSAAFALIHGKNVITADYYSDNADGTDDVHDLHIPVFYLNYVSDKHMLGDGVHNKTIHWLQNTQTNPIFTNPSPNWSSNYLHITSSAPAVPETMWSMYSGMSTCFYPYRMFVVANTYLQPGERSGMGVLLFDVPNCQAGYYSETMYSNQYKLFDRYKNDPDDSRLDPFLTRNYDVNRLFSAGGESFGSEWVFTYHSITFVATGSVRGFVGDGSGISIGLHDASTHVLLFTGSTIVGGTYAITGFDNSQTVYTEARQDGMRLGRSDNFYMV